MWIIDTIALNNWVLLKFNNSINKLNKWHIIISCYISISPIFLIRMDISNHISDILKQEHSSMRGSQKNVVNLTLRIFHVALGVFPTNFTLFDIFSDGL